MLRKPAARALAAGAVNTLVRAADGWHGDNTDGVGLCRDIVDNLMVPLSGTRILFDLTLPDAGTPGAKRMEVPAAMQAPGIAP